MGCKQSVPLQKEFGGPSKYYNEGSLSNRHYVTTVKKEERTGNKTSSNAITAHHGATMGTNRASSNAVSYNATYDLLTPVLIDSLTHSHEGSHHHYGGGGCDSGGGGGGGGGGGCDAGGGGGGGCGGCGCD